MATDFENGKSALGEKTEKYGYNGAVDIPDPDAGLSVEERAKIVSGHIAAEIRP